MTQCIALLRGINVGRAKRIPMADLRRLIEDLGHTQVRTLLNSGNALFHAPRANAARVAAALQDGIQEQFGHAVPVIVLTAQELDAIVAANPLPQATAEPSRFLVAFIASNAVLVKAQPLLAQDWAPDALALGRQAAYLHCANGLIESRLAQAFSRATGDAATTRNWATVLKLQAAAKNPG